MKTESGALETAVSFARRLAHGRVEILKAEQERRANGGTLAELIEQLPKILAGDQGRSSAANTRHAEFDDDILELTWEDGRQHLVADDSLANLVSLGDAELSSTIAQLGEFEAELSGFRRALHGVIDVIEGEIASRVTAAN